MMSITYRAMLVAVVVLLSVPSAQAGWRKLSNHSGIVAGTGNVTGIYTFAQNSNEVALFYRCGFAEAPVCRLDIQLALSCDLAKEPVNIPIQYGDKTTIAKLECRGIGGTIQEGAGGVRLTHNASRITKEERYSRETYSWTVTLPGQGSGPVPVFTDKKLTFIFEGNKHDYKYTFSTKGASKAMEKVYQNWIKHKGQEK